MALFETVWRREELGHLNVFAVNSLFTAMIQLSAEMRVGNPILAANALRRFDTALEVLQALAEYWLNAEIIFRLFEESSERLQQDLRIGKAIRTATRPAVSDHQEPWTSHASEPEVTLTDPTLSATNWHSLFPTEPAIMPSNNGIEDTDWNNLYWENSGFPSLSPFGTLNNIYPPR